MCVWSGESQWKLDLGRIKAHGAVEERREARGERRTHAKPMLGCRRRKMIV